jgi:hypothetical protein
MSLQAVERLRARLEAWRLKDGYVPAYIAGWNAMLDQALAALEASPSLHPEGEGLDLRRLSGDESDPFSFYADDLDDGRALTQHRYYRFGDDIVIAVGEINFRNSWDDEAFDAACAVIEAALTPSTVTEGTVPDDGVERAARAMLALRVARTDETWQRYRQPESWRLFEEDARAALAASPKPTIVEASGMVERRYRNALQDIAEAEAIPNDAVAFVWCRNVAREVLSASSPSSEQGRG